MAKLIKFQRKRAGIGGLAYLELWNNTTGVNGKIHRFWNRFSRLLGLLRSRARPSLIAIGGHNAGCAAAHVSARRAKSIHYFAKGVRIFSAKKQNWKMGEI